MEQTPDLQQLLRLAQSPAGKQLLQYLQQQNGSALKAAADLASSGNYEAAKNKLSGIMCTPEAQQLLKQLEGQK